ncbi:hypothetical protein GCM10029964_103650 [Kibdelosporangium lantanae]
MPGNRTRGADCWTSDSVTAGNLSLWLSPTYAESDGPGADWPAHPVKTRVVPEAETRGLSTDYREV